MKTRLSLHRNLAATPIEKILGPLQRAFHSEAFPGLLLLGAAIVAMIWANGPWSAAYHSLWRETRFGVSAGGFDLSKPLLLWVNDGLMAIFFFLIGLEIKREVLAGQLSSFRQAVLPLAAAVGGMAAPGLIYLALNPSGEAARGWGIPMATDIAFSLGVLALCGRHVPSAARVFLTAFAIVDDIGATLIIAVFYTESVSGGHLLAGAIVALAMTGLNLLGVRHALPYSLLGAVLWYLFLKSGVHPTVAGVLAAITIPARPRVGAGDFRTSAREGLEDVDRSADDQHHVLANPELAQAIYEVEGTCRLAQTPLQMFERALHPWVSALIMPVFALANAGVVLEPGTGQVFGNVTTLGVAAGLIFGKAVGVGGAAWLAVRLGLATLPAGVSWRQMLGLSLLGGIGFTMSLFIAGLAFHDPALNTAAKVGILVGSAVSGWGGWLVLRSTRARHGAAAAASAVRLE